MATPKEIKTRIDSVKNTRKITKTMELVATAKSKKAVDRVHASQPYADKVTEMLESLASGQLDVSHPLLRKAEKPKKVLLIAITANRGLAGPYNTNVLKALVAAYEEYKSRGIEPVLYVAGKKAVNFLRFQKIPFERSYLEFDDRVTFAQAEVIAQEAMDLFEYGKVDGVELIYTRYFNAGTQKVVNRALLPLSFSAKGKGPAAPYIIEPSPEKLISALLPRSIKIVTFQAFLDAAASEQIARRIAMKNATDSASDMIKEMTLKYNRARQAKVTQEIAEIISGVDALK